MLKRGYLVQFFLSFVASCVVLAGVFWIVGLQPTNGQVKETAENDSFSASAPRVRQLSGTLDRGKASKFLQEIADRGSSASAFESALALDSLLVRADSNLLQDLFIESSSISRVSAQLLVQSELLRRLATVDPIQAMGLLKDRSRLDQERLARAVFEEWSSTDLDSAIEYATTLQPSYLRVVAYRAMLEISEELTDSEIEEMGRQLGLTPFQIQDIATALEHASAKSDAAIWHRTVVGDQPYTHKYWALVGLAKRRIDEKGLAEIAIIGESMSDRRTRRGVLRESIKFAARSDPKSTFEFALSSYRDTDVYLVTEALNHWIEREPEHALNAISKLEPSQLQTELYHDAISYWMDYEPREVLRNLELLPSEMRNGARLTALANISDFSVQEVSRLVAELPDDSRFRAIRAIVGNWKNYAFAEALDWALANSLAKRRSVAEQLFEGIGKVNAELALSRVLNHPSMEEKGVLLADIVAHLAESDVNSAVALLPRLRNEEIRKKAIVRTGTRLAMRHKYDAAWDFGSRLSKSERPDFYDRLIGGWLAIQSLQPDPIKPIEMLPTSELQSRAAMWTILYGHAEENLSLSDKTKLREYLTEADKAKLKRTEIEITITP